MASKDVAGDDWQLLLNKASQCLQTGDYQNAKIAVDELYESASHHKGCNTEMALKIYDACLRLTQRFNYCYLGIKCHYQVKLLSRKGYYPFSILALWTKYLEAKNIELCQKLGLIKEIWGIIDEYKNIAYHPAVWHTVDELTSTFGILTNLYILSPRRSAVIKQHNLEHAVRRGWLLLSLGRFDDVCEICKELELFGIEDCDIFSLLELWAFALSKCNKYDIALKKIEQAYMERKQDHDFTSLSTLRDEILNKQRNKSNDSLTVDNEWLKGTPVQSLKKMSESAENARQKYIERQSRRKSRTKHKKKTVKDIKDLPTREGEYGDDSPDQTQIINERQHSEDTHRLQSSDDIRKRECSDHPNARQQTIERKLMKKSKAEYKQTTVKDIKVLRTRESEYGDDSENQLQIIHEKQRSEDNDELHSSAYTHTRECSDDSNAGQQYIQGKTREKLRTKYKKTTVKEITREVEYGDDSRYQTQNIYKRQRSEGTHRLQSSDDIHERESLDDPKYDGNVASAQNHALMSKEFYCIAEREDTNDNDLQQEDFSDNTNTDQTTFFEESCHFWSSQHKYADSSEMATYCCSVAGFNFSDSFIDNFDNCTSKFTNVYHELLPDHEALKLLKDNPRKFKLCKLNIKSTHESSCLNLDFNDKVEKIIISGRSKCGRTFCDDEVIVKILNMSPFYNQWMTQGETDCHPTQSSLSKVYGKVMAITKRNRYVDIKNPVLLCTLDKYCTTLMKPVCKTVPKIYVKNANIPRHLFSRSDQTFEVPLYTYDKIKNELKSKSTKVIDPGNREECLFLVCFIKWTGIHPVGVVIHVFDTFENTLSQINLLCLKYHVPSLYREKTVECIDKKKKLLKRDSIDNTAEDLSEKLFVFTIDSPDSKDLDDAISINHVQNNVYEIGVHITDVARIVHKDDPVDQEAQERTTTFYPGLGHRSHHMLPEPISLHRCSLLPNCRRHCISVFFKVNMNGLILGKPTIKRTIVMSSAKLTYEEVERLVKGTINAKSRSLQKDLTTLVEITKQLKHNRIGNKIFSFKCEEDFLETLELTSGAVDAQNMVSELMIQTNHFIANFLIEKFPDSVPLRIQNFPTEENVRMWRTNFSNVKNLILMLQDLSLPDQGDVSLYSTDTEEIESPIPIQAHIWQKIQKNLKNRKYQEVGKLIGSDIFHPEHAIALLSWYNIQEVSQFKCSGNLKNSDELRHFSLEIAPYTQFTSPLRRYLDLVVHRMVQAALDKEKKPPYSKKEISYLCEKVNKDSFRAKQFHNECKLLQLGKGMNKEPRLFNAIIQEVNEKEIVLHVPGLRCLFNEGKTISLKDLNICSKPVLNNTDCVLKQNLSLRWQQRLYSLTGYHFQTSRQKQHDSIDPNQRVVFVQKRIWKSILKEMICGKFQNIASIVANENNEPDTMVRNLIPSSKGTVVDVSSEVRDGDIVKQCCDFNMKLGSSQVFSVQYFAETQKGVTKPRIQLLEITHNVKICLQHSMDPVKTLSRYATSRFDPSTKSINKYVQSWLAIYCMESAVKMVQNVPLVINDVLVSFEEHKGSFILSNAFCDKRDLNFGCFPPSLILGNKESNEKEKEPILSPDCVCIRCELVSGSHPGTKATMDMNPNNRRIWIGHGEIVELQEKEESDTDQKNTKIIFNLHNKSPRPTDKMLRASKPIKCSVEILQKAENDKRVEVSLKLLENSSELAQRIALGRKSPPLDKCYLDAADKVRIDVPICGLAGNNEKQLLAMKTSLRSSFTLIQGPPGTGKTFTGIKLTYLFAKINNILREEGSEHKQVVFCGPSNKSVDLVARIMLRRLTVHERIHDEKDKWIPKFVRMYGSSIESTIYPIPGRDYSNIRSCKNNRPDEKIAEISLHNLIRMEGKPYANKLKSFDKLFKNKEVPDFEIINEYQSVLSKATQEELHSYDIIFCTTAVATNPKFLKATRGSLFQLIIDEAGMCTEPETLAPIIATRAKQVVLIGDHKQLQPILSCQETASLGLGKSMFERLSNRAIMLTSQYRMNPEICRFPSDMFYKGKLETVQSHHWSSGRPLAIWKDHTYPFVFCHVEGEEESLTVSTAEGNTQSKSNIIEVEHVVRIFTYLMTVERLQTENVNIISQYNAQCSLIKGVLSKERFINTNVNTVVSSQGGEWDYVIFSTVRSLPKYRIEKNPSAGWKKHNLGFITDYHQINVALTRAKKGIIIIGNKNLMKCDPVWDKLWKHYDSHGCTIDAEDFPPLHQRTS